MTPRRTQGSEAAEQRALIHWSKLATARLPELAYLFHVPNVRSSRFQRMALGLEGVKSGVPDLILPVARGGYFSLAIEMKAIGGTVSPTQANYLDFLRDQGWQALVCFGSDQAQEAIETYLALAPTAAIVEMAVSA